MRQGAMKVHWLFLLVVVVTGILYAPILGNYFLNDDFGRILQLKPLQEESIPEALSILFSRAFNSYYRPLTYVTFFLLYKSSALAPFSYYLSSVVFHMLASMALCSVASSLSEEIATARFRWIAVLATLFFVVHPRQVESVSYIHDNENVICGLFFFLGVAWYIKHCQCQRWKFLWLSCFAYLCSLLGKEMGVSLPLICLAYHFHFVSECSLSALAKDKRIRSAVFFWGITFLFYMALRYNSLGTWVGGSGETSQLDFSLLRITRTLCQAMWAMILPNDLPVMEVVAGFFRVHIGLFIFVCLTCGMGIAWRLRNYRSKTFWFGIMWTVFSLIPILNNGIGVASLTGGRYLYIPLAGFVLSAADLLRRLPHKTLRIFACGLLVVVLSGFTYRNNAKLSRISEISESFLKGIGNIIHDETGADGRYAIFLPSMYRGMYMLRSSLQPGLSLLYGEGGEDFLRDRISLIIELHLDETERLDLKVSREDVGTVIAELKGGSSFLGNGELDSRGMIEDNRPSFHDRRFINTRGDFVTKTVRFKQVDRIVAPDLSPGSSTGVIVYDFSHSSERGQ